MSYLRVVTLVVIFMVAVTSASADDSVGVLPDEPGYKLKIERERVELRATLGINDRVRLYMRYAERRLKEADEMASRRKPEFVKDLLKEYRRYIERATDEIEQAEAVGYGVDTALREVERTTEKHLSILKGLKTKVPEKALPAITRALDVSRKGRETTLKRLGKVQGREHPSGREDGVGRGSHTAEDLPLMSSHPTEVCTVVPLHPLQVEEAGGGRKSPPILLTPSHVILSAARHYP